MIGSALCPRSRRGSSPAAAASPASSSSPPPPPWRLVCSCDMTPPVVVVQLNPSSGGREKSSAAGEGLHQLFGGAGVVDQLADVAAGAAQRLEGGDPHQRLPPQVEDDRIPGGGGD